MLLIRSISALTSAFPESIPTLLSSLMDSFLMFRSKALRASLETILFVKEVIEVHPEHRGFIFRKICDNLSDINASLVLRVALWIAVEHAKT